MCHVAFCLCALYVIGTSDGRTSTVTALPFYIAKMLKRCLTFPLRLNENTLNQTLKSYFEVSWLILSINWPHAHSSSVVEFGAGKDKHDECFLYF